MKTAVEWLVEQLDGERHLTENEIKRLIQQAKEMEQKQLFLASNISAKEAYKAGQQTMHCGCYEISDATTYKEWLYEQFKSE
jgi:phosphopantetheinyl transferase (holo-ACP synthase)